jgi:L-amino acid N-acyltransferase YncA
VSIVNIEIRPAREEDLLLVQRISEHCVLDTVVSFLIKKPPPDYIKSRFEAAKSRKLPYLVAWDPERESVVGYTYASAFRGFMLGYGHTVEMSPFCHPDHTNQGVGSKMMIELLEHMRHTKHVSHEVGNQAQQAEFEIKKVLAIMAVDESAPKNGLALRDWYIKWGFEEFGRLKHVGFKNGRR